jgi:hypothetical protein
MSRSRLVRTAALVLAGGVLIQAGGCAVSTFAPLALSLLESLLLGTLTGGTLAL